MRIFSSQNNNYPDRFIFNLNKYLQVLTSVGNKIVLKIDDENLQRLENRGKRLRNNGLSNNVHVVLKTEILFYSYQ